MTLSSSVTIDCFDGAYTFALKGKQIEELQRLCNAGLGEIGQRIMSGNWYIADISQTIRMGLIGGGDVAPTRATELIQTYVDGCPIAPENDPSGPLEIARAIIEATFFGLSEVADEKPGEQPAGVTAS